MSLLQLLPASALSLLLFAHPAPQQTPKVTPPQLDLGERQFDFMIGSWDVFAGGQQQYSVSADFALNGQSIQITNPVSTSYATWIPKEQVWRQTWMSTNGHHDLMEGRWEGDGIYMVQELLRDRPGMIGRLGYHDMEPDSFRRTWEISGDKGETWTLMQDAQYKRNTPQEVDISETLAGKGPDAPDEISDYAFKLGTWDMTCIAQTPGGGVFPGVGTTRAYFAEDGVTILDDVTVTFNGLGGFAGQTIRKFNEAKGAWECSWNPKGKAPNSFEARYNAEEERVIEAFSGTDAMGNFNAELSFYEITEDSYRGRMDHFYEDGTVVRGFWEYVATRLPG